MCQMCEEAKLYMTQLEAAEKAAAATRSESAKATRKDADPAVPAVAPASKT